MAGCSLDDPPQALIAFYGYGDIAGDWYAKPDQFYRETQTLIAREEALKGVGKEVVSGVAFDVDKRSEGSHGPGANIEFATEPRLRCTHDGRDEFFVKRDIKRASQPLSIRTDWHRRSDSIQPRRTLDGVTPSIPLLRIK